MYTSSREYWIINIGPGFLAVVWFGIWLFSHPLSPARTLDRRHKWRLRKWDSLVGGGGRGAESYKHKKAWFSTYYSILSDITIILNLIKGIGPKSLKNTLSKFNIICTQIFLDHCYFLLYLRKHRYWRWRINYWLLEVRIRIRSFFSCKQTLPPRLR